MVHRLGSRLRQAAEKKLGLCSNNLVVEAELSKFESLIYISDLQRIRS